MTKNESLILKYLKPLVSVSYTDLLGEFRDSSAAECSIVRPEDRIEYLIAAGLISSNDNFLSITPIGLHELDEYVENQTRLDRVEKATARANVISIASAIFAALTAIATASAASAQWMSLRLW